MLAFLYGDYNILVNAQAHPHANRFSAQPAVLINNVSHEGN